MRRLACAALVIVAASCAAPPVPVVTPEQIAARTRMWDLASRVKVTINPDQVHGCTLLGPLEVTWLLQGYEPDPLHRDENLPYRVLMWKAMQMGGNAVLRDMSGTPDNVKRLEDELRKVDMMSPRFEQLRTQLRAQRWVAGEAYKCPETVSK
jgi:hypothetical protein